MKKATSKISLKAMSWKLVRSSAVSVGAPPLGSVPPACSSVAFRAAWLKLGKPFDSGNEKGLPDLRGGATLGWVEGAGTDGRVTVEVVGDPDPGVL